MMVLDGNQMWKLFIHACENQTPTDYQVLGEMQRFYGVEFRPKDVTTVEDGANMTKTWYDVDCDDETSARLMMLL